MNVKWYKKAQTEEKSKKTVKLLVFQGSPRSEETCPSQDGKTKDIVSQVLSNFWGDPRIKVDVVDLSVKGDGKIIQPCKACVSTSAAHCHFYCTCYGPMNEEVPDKMHDDNIYGRLEWCDAFVVFSPIHWYSVPTSVKAMFDRLVCVNKTITHEQAVAMWGEDIKNPDKTKRFSETDRFKKMAKNHLEGKVGAFFIHGDFGANDYLCKGENDAESIEDFVEEYENCEKMPKSLKMNEKIIKEEIHWSSPRAAIMPIVNQCRYSGIFVPDDLIDGVIEHVGISYSKANDLGMSEDAIERANNLIEKIIGHIG